MESRVVFERNLAVLRKRNPLLASALEAASTDGIEEEVGPRGARVLKQGGVRLGSAYDPAREAEQMAAAMAQEPADVMVALGFGLGEHFTPYLERNPATLIIYEPSIQRLKAALHRISIANLIATHKDLYLTTELDQFSRIFSGRYAPGLRVRVFPHPAVLRLDAVAVGEAVEWTRRAKNAVDSRIVTSVEMLMPWASITAQNGSRIAATPNLGRLERAFQGRPAVVVAAGPSLDKQLPLLREVQDRVVILAIGQTVRALRAAGIEPHLVHIFESRDVSHQLKDAGDTTSLCTAYTPDCHSAIFDTPTRATFCAISGASAMGAWISKAAGETCLTMGGGTVAQGAVGLAAVLGCNPVALIGQDLAFTDGRVYAKDSAYDFVEVEMTGEGSCTFNHMTHKEKLIGDRNFQARGDKSPKREVVWVKGWNEGERVPTWPAYAAFLEQYRDIGRVFQARGLSLINCTEGGARIPEVEHKAFREFLADAAVEPFEIRDVILDAYDSAPRLTFDDFSASIEEARRLLSRVEEETKKGRKFALNVRDRLRSAKQGQQQIEILRRLARYEKKVRGHLDRIPWLDALVQPEIHTAVVASRRSERIDASLEDLADESTFLFTAAENGIARARQWFDAFSASFDAEEVAARPATSSPQPAKTARAEARFVSPAS